MTTDRAGYLIVRIPEHAEPRVRMDDIDYSGVFRNPWAYLSKAYYDGGDEQASDFYRQIKTAKCNRRDVTEIDVVRDFDAASEIFRYVRDKEGEIHQLVVLASEKLARIKGGPLSDEQPVRWLGYDLIHGWSLVKTLMQNGVFRSTLRSLLNANGLLEDPADGEQIIEVYDRAVEQFGAGFEGLDPRLEDARIPTMAVRVGEVPDLERL